MLLSQNQCTRERTVKGVCNRILEDASNLTTIETFHMFGLFHDAFLF